jgi:hypothetical protein
LTYWTVGRESRSTPRSRQTLHLLPIYDEFLVAYRDHRAVPRPAYVLGGFQHALVIGGGVAGTWRTRPDTKGIAVDVETVGRLKPVERRALAQAVTRYGRFLGVPVSLAVT